MNMDKPYASGGSCGACPNSCKNNLCGKGTVQILPNNIESVQVTPSMPISKPVIEVFNGI